MKTSAIILGVFIFFSISTAVDSLAEQEIPGPPLAQSLVREGTLAVNLANALKIGSPTGEAEAESALTSAGIAPRNGWIGDYPVTPDVAIELRNAVGSAADSRGLSMSREEALNVFDNVMRDYELPVSAANARPTVNPNTSPGTDPPPPDPTVINNYYTEEGPPVVTYYAPPADYSYLYNYVPSPFWWLNVWFPGYYILADFIFPLFGFGWWQHGYWGGYGYGYWGGYERYGYWGGYGYSHWRGDDHDGHHGGHGDNHYAVSNHYRYPDGGATHRINPANRAHGGSFSDGTRAGGQRWANPAAQRSAGAIYNRNSHVNTARDSVNMRQPVNDRTGYNRGYNFNTGRSFNAPARSYSANRSFDRPAQRASYQTRQNTYSPGRMGVNDRYNSNLNGGRSFNAPSRSYSVNRSFNQPAQRASYQTRQSMFSSPRGGGHNASFVANRGQSGGGRSFSSGHNSFSGRSSFSGGGHGHGKRR